MAIYHLLLFPIMAFSLSSPFSPSNESLIFPMSLTRSTQGLVREANTERRPDDLLCRKSHKVACSSSSS